VLRLALRATVDFLSEEQGRSMDEWQWGMVPQADLPARAGPPKPLDEIFNRGPYPIGGDGQTIWAKQHDGPPGLLRGVVGPPFRFIADLADLDRSQGLLVPGQSGQVGSPALR
jgi:penicillin G amidase